jgi:hypothetical protein
MLETLSRTRFPRVRVQWFCERPALAACLGLAEFKQCATAGFRLGFVRRPFHTKLVDLDQEPDAILAGFQSRTRSMVRQAQKLGITTGGFPDRAQFVATYNAFADRRGLARLPAHHPLANPGPSRVTAAHLDGRILVMRGYLLDRDKARVRNLVSCTALHAADDTETPKLTGLAHRLLVYADMLAFRSEGFTGYDFGGYAVGTADPKLASINRFKDSFGGRIIAESNYVTWPLHLWLTARDWARRSRVAIAPADPVPDMQP